MPLTHDAETWQRRLAALPLASYEAGATVLTEGTKTGQLLILRSGAVSIVTGGIEIAKVAEPGAIFGELSALLNRPHSADVRTLEPSQFHVADAVSLLAQDEVALLYVATVLARRVDYANQSLLELKSGLDAGHPPSSIENAIGRIIQGLLTAIGDSYVRGGAGISVFPPAW